MSTLYSVDITLNAKYTKKNIQHLLEKLLENECIIFSEGPERDISRFFTIEQATNAILKTPENESPVLNIKYQDTFFDFFVWKKEEKIEVSLSDPCSKWYKEFKAGNIGHWLDFARYARLLLKICKDFSILELKTETD